MNPFITTLVAGTVFTGGVMVTTSMQDLYEQRDDVAQQSLNIYNQQLGTNLTLDDLEGNRQAYQDMVKGEINTVHYIDGNNIVTLNLADIPGYEEWRQTDKEVMETFHNLPANEAEKQRLVDEGYAKLNQKFEGMEFLNLLEYQDVFVEDGKLFIAKKFTM